MTFPAEWNEKEKVLEALLPLSWLHRRRNSVRLKFIADADLNQDLVRGVLRHDASIDFLSASDGGTPGLADRQVLELAAATGRILVSHDRHTMTEELYRFPADGHSSPGLIIVTQEMDEGDAIDDLLLIWAASPAQELRDRVRWVPIRTTNE